MTKWPQKFLLTKSIVMLVILIFVSNLVVGCRSIDYPVRVLAKDTHEAVANAEVTIEVRGKVPLAGITDSNGLAKVFIYSSYAGKPAELVVRATGYETHRQYVDLTKDALPDTILLVGSGAVVSGPKHTPTPTSTSIAADTPSAPYPAPILVNPVYGETIIGETVTDFSWRWDVGFQERVLFDLRIWRPEKSCCTVAMSYENGRLLDAPPDGFGHYLWQVAVVRIDESGKSILSESQVWPFVWSDVPPTATPTSTPTATPTDIPTNIPTGTPMPIPPTNTPTVTPTPTLLPPPIPLAPANGECFIGEPVTFRWQWDYGPLEPDEVFSLRVYREGTTEPCHHDKTDGLEYSGHLSYCQAGKHYWRVALARKREGCLDETDPHCWQTLSEASVEQWIYYTPGDEEPWVPSEPDREGGDKNREDKDKD